MSDATAKTLAEKVFEAQRAYYDAHHDLDEAVIAIFGGLDNCRAENWGVEQDSDYDNSIEVRMREGCTLSDDERSALRALGFSLVWNDERSAPKRSFSRPEIARMVKAAAESAK